MSDSKQQTTVFDDESMHVGQVYAKALLNAAQSSNSVDSTVSQLESLVVDVLDKQPTFELALGNPKVPAEEKIRLLDKIFVATMDPTLLKFLKVVVTRHRFNAIRSIYQSVMTLRDEAMGRLRIVITTAQPLDSEAIANLTTKLKVIFNKEVVLSTKIDSSILGGLLIRVGDVVFDGSVDGQLKQLRAATMIKSEQAIRDKLSSLAS